MNTVAINLVKQITPKSQPMKNALRREIEKKRLTVLINFSLACITMIGLVVIIYMAVNGKL